jgi:hypothetical protein
MSGKPGVFICPSCEAVVRSEKSLEEGIVCGKCQHEFGASVKSATASAKPVQVPKGAIGNRKSSVMRNLTGKKAPPVLAVKSVESAAVNAKPIQEVADEAIGTEGDLEIMMPDGSRRVRRRKKRAKKEKNKGLILFLAGWLSVIGIIFALFKMGKNEERISEEEQGSDLTVDATKREVLRRYLEPVKAEFLNFISHPTNEGREQYIADSANLSLEFARHGQIHPFPKPVFFPKPNPKLYLIAKNVLAFSEEDYAIETIWQDREGNRFAAVHIWDQDAWRIDWENFAPYSTEPWARFRSELGSDKGVFRLLVRKRRTADEAEKFTLSFYRPPEFLEKNNEYLNTVSPEVDVKTDSDLGREFLKLWENHRSGEAPYYGNYLSKILDPGRGNYLRITVELAWEKNERDESIMVLKDVIGVSWFGEAIQKFHREALKEASDRAENKIAVEKPVTDINEAVLAEDLETVKQHISYGTDINSGNSYGITPLHWASGNQESGKITELLLKHGANVDAERTDGATPMHHATHYNKIKSVEALLRYGANLEARDGSQFGSTPLHAAAWRSDPQIVELLITEGAEVNSLDLKNQTPLDLATLYKKEDNVKILLKYKGERKEDLERLLTLSVDGVEVSAKKIIKDFPQFEYFYITSSGAFSLDELRIGKTYESVTGDPSSNDPNIIFSDSFDYLEGEKLVNQMGWYSISHPADCYTIRKGSLISDKIKSSGNRLSSDATDTNSGLGIKIPDNVSFENEDTIYLSFLMRPEGTIGVGRWGGYFLVGAKPLDGKGILFGKPGSTAVPDDEKYGIDKHGGPHIVTSGVEAKVNKTSFVVVKMESNASGKEVSEVKPHAVQFDSLEERKGIRYLKRSDTPYTGKFFLIHSNGQKRATGDFKDGKPEGLMTFWYKNGQREMEGTFKDGKRNGQVIWRHANGQKKGEANFKDGEPISGKYWTSKGEEVDSLEEAGQ